MKSLRRKQNSGMLSCPFPWKVRRLCLHITVCNSSISTPRIFLKRILHMRRNACVFFPVCMVYFSQWMPYSRIVWKCRHVCLLREKGSVFLLGKPSGTVSVEGRGKLPLYYQSCQQGICEGGASLSSTGELLHSNLLHRKRRQAENGIHTGEKARGCMGKLDHNPSDTYR